MKDFSFITNSDSSAIEQLYQSYLKDANSVDEELKSFFVGFDFATSNSSSIKVEQNEGNTAFTQLNNIDKEFNVYQLICAYRKKAHLVSKTNPIRPRKDRHATLELINFNLSNADLDTEFNAGKFVNLGKVKLSKIIEFLETCYCGSVGLDISSINYDEKIKWLQESFEKKMLTEKYALTKKRRILDKLNQATLFEKFLHTKYVGQKRFSLEGGESVVPALDWILNQAADLEVKQVAIGMAHRGRLNILANIMHKTYEQIFNEFEGNINPGITMGSGDVKYHLGFRSSLTTYNNKEINVHLCSNPSHLEAVNPVVSGYLRAYADVLHNEENEKTLPIIIHGDAAIAGQGIVYEHLQMSQLDGYKNAGTLHIVINNQIGFTTDYADARSSDYCTSLAATLQSPVLHVNGDDVEAVVKCGEIAVEFRQKFKEDVFIDMLCYRKYGHNEGDDPKFTQPQLYGLIEQHSNVREIYINYLKQHDDSNVQQLADEFERKFWEDLQSRLDGVKQKTLPYLRQEPENQWRKLKKAQKEDFISSPKTGISKENFDVIFNKIMSYPENFTPLKKIKKLLDEKIHLFQNSNEIDWATGELMAYASLLVEGKNLRISGEDVKRGTFSHRHLCLFDENNNQQLNRLQNITPEQGKIRIFNSLLSEYAVLGFEYGYSIVDTNTLTVWEAQFGDFANGAQIIIDQFISSGEEKWQQYSGLVMLLPHGYEGQGPEHSSARMERFLQMCAEENMVITNITIASNLFHAIRRQLTWNFRKPLINFSPKGNLRLKNAYAHYTELLDDTKFQEVLDCPFVVDVAPETINKVLFCSGKIYFDLYEHQAKENIKNVAVIRLEQLYPLPENQLDALVKKYSNAVWYWVQEEPMNMGAVAFLQLYCKSFDYGVISRKPSAATATGYAKTHQTEQQNIIYTAFNV